MTGFAAFLRKELSEAVRTWRGWVVPAILLLFAVSGPPLALATKALLRSSGLPADIIPDPTWREAHASWAKNISQLGLFAVLLLGAGAVAGERRSGTAQLVLTKPVSRTGFVLAKFCSLAVVTLVGAVVGGAVDYAVTLACFPGAPLAPLARATGAWLALALVMGAVALLLSVLLDSTVAALGAAFGVALLLGIAGLWGPLVRYTPVGLFGLPGAFAVDGPARWGWPLATAAVALAALLALACLAFRRREL